MKPQFLPLLVISSALGMGLILGIKHFTKKNDLKDKLTQVQTTESTPPQKTQVGDILHTFNGVHVYENGEDFTISHSKHSAEDGYYYGHQWQCVEFVKRYYHNAHQHHMPDVMGHAKDFFDPNTKQGELNKARNMLQYHNGGNDKPQKYDLLVWNHNSYGHVAVITKVTKDSVFVVQQNVKGFPIQQLSLVEFKNHFNVNAGTRHPPAGWLRLPNK